MQLLPHACQDLSVAAPRQCRGRHDSVRGRVRLRDRAAQRGAVADFVDLIQALGRVRMSVRVPADQHVEQDSQMTQVSCAHQFAGEATASLVVGLGVEPGSKE